MIGIFATLIAKSGRKADFEAAFRQMAAAVRTREPGAELYQLCKVQKAPDTYRVMELYVDQAAVEAHRSNYRYRALGVALRDLLEAPPAVEMLDTVGDDQRGAGPGA